MWLWLFFILTDPLHMYRIWWREQQRGRYVPLSKSSPLWLTLWRTVVCFLEHFLLNNQIDCLWIVSGRGPGSVTAVGWRVFEAELFSNWGQQEGCSWKVTGLRLWGCCSRRPERSGYRYLHRQVQPGISIECGFVCVNWQINKLMEVIWKMCVVYEASFTLNSDRCPYSRSGALD